MCGLKLNTHEHPDVFPLRLRWLLRIPWYNYSEQSIQGLLEKPSVSETLMAGADPAHIIEKLHPDSGSVKVTEVIPRLKEGGAFVKFTHGESTSSEDAAAAIKAYLKRKQIKPKWNPFQRIRADLVRGRPWLEDLYRGPSTRVRVDFLPAGPGGQPAEMSQEDLYALFRPFGKLVDITPQPADSKVLPKYALLDFFGTRRAAMAKNCMHGYRVMESEGGGASGTLLKMAYEQKETRAHWIWNWLMNHPRIVIPVLVGLLGTFTVAVFDP